MQIQVDGVIIVILLLVIICVALSITAIILAKNAEPEVPAETVTLGSEIGTTTIQGKEGITFSSDGVIDFGGMQYDPKTDSLNITAATFTVNGLPTDELDEGIAKTIKNPQWYVVTDLDNHAHFLIEKNNLNLTFAQDFFDEDNYIMFQMINKPGQQVGCTIHSDINIHLTFQNNLTIVGPEDPYFFSAPNGSEFRARFIITHVEENDGVIESVYMDVSVYENTGIFSGWG